ncbi:hypothetical protein IC607_13705 [Cellulomonas sp. JH27-2]|uniref:hypothetical protein n=1 Tax=Cellulomonas sp. JH27-2 TaxID=2774139 RepID=UPI001781B37D|nr:hypothetical protein [Cellulomonas sp. JH27-2]MBD8060025.1 hypothetical protein [Cellulomonas sp. JH27-2]
MELDFEERADEARQSAAAVLEGAQRSDGVDLPDVEPEPARVPRDEDPSYAVVAAYARVAVAVRSLAAASNIRQPPPGTSTARIVLALHKAGVVSAGYVESVKSLVELRNVVAHGQQRITFDEAKAYVEAANELVSASNVLASLQGRA